jgi:hypothetical protein
MAEEEQRGRGYGRRANPDYRAKRNREAFRRHYDVIYGDARYPFEHYMPAYVMGHELAEEPVYRDQAWEDAKPAVRRVWEERHGSTWKDYKEAVRHGWRLGRKAEPNPWGEQ